MNSTAAVKDPRLPPLTTHFPVKLNNSGHHRCSEDMIECIGVAKMELAIDGPGKNDKYNEDQYSIIDQYNII